MILRVAIELDLFDIISKNSTHHGHLSASEIASHLPIKSMINDQSAIITGEKIPKKQLLLHFFQNKEKIIIPILVAYAS